jgi:hypothetical protein
MPEANIWDEIAIVDVGMGGVAPGAGTGFAPFAPDEARLFLGSPEIEGSANNGSVTPPPLGLSMALLSNTLFNTSIAKRSISDFLTPPVDAENLNVLPELPNQLKSLYAGVHDNTLVKTKILSPEKDIVNDYRNLGLYYFNYQLIYKIEILSGFEADGITSPIYEPLSGQSLEKYRGKTIMCRSSLYTNSKIIDAGVHAKMHLPLLNQFFLLEVEGTKPEDFVEEVDDSIVGFSFVGDFVFIPPQALQEDTEPEMTIGGFTPIIVPGLLAPGTGLPTTGGGYSL